MQVGFERIEKFNASMNTVPVIGLKDRNIMYVNTTAVESADKKTTSLKYSWMQFATLPAGADPATGTVRFFPYLGNFCLAIGKTVWTKKQVRGEDRDALSKSINNWAKLYEDTWDKKTDACLPASNLKDVTPFATISEDRSVTKWYLITLDRNSQLQFCEQYGDLKDNMTFTSLSYTKTDKGPAMAPILQRVVYFNNQLVAYDTSGTLWTLAVNFDNKTYSVVDSSNESLPSGTELTASDIGPIVQRSDGKLYRRIVQISNASPSYSWESWLDADGVKNLGVASPGVKLDLK